MSLEALQNQWDSLDQSAEQNQLSNEQIKTMLKDKYWSYLNRSFVLEILILFACLYFIALTIFRFDVLEKTYLEAIALVSILLLFSLFIIRAKNLVDLYRYKYLNYSHAAVIKRIARKKTSIQKYYLANLILGFIILVMLVILNIKIYNEYELVQNKYFWMTILPSSFVFILLSTIWVRKHHEKAISEAEALLNQLK